MTTTKEQIIQWAFEQVKDETDQFKKINMAMETLAARILEAEQLLFFAKTTVQDCNLESTRVLKAVLNYDNKHKGVKDE